MALPLLADWGDVRPCSFWPPLRSRCNIMCKRFTYLHSFKGCSHLENATRGLLWPRHITWYFSALSLPRLGIQSWQTSQNFTTVCTGELLKEQLPEEPEDLILMQTVGQNVTREEANHTVQEKPRRWSSTIVMHQIGLSQAILR